jgi:hypothetical protein
MSFISILVTIGKGFAKGLQWAVQYAVPVERLVAVLFPTVAPAALGLAEATTLIQHAVLLVEQKYAAAGIQHGTGPAKLDEVVVLCSQVVISLLDKAGIKADTSYVARLVSAIVAILNLQTDPLTTTA